MALHAPDTLATVVPSAEVTTRARRLSLAAAESAQVGTRTRRHRLMNVIVTIVLAAILWWLPPGPATLGHNLL